MITFRGNTPNFVLIFESRDISGAINASCFPKPNIVSGFSAPEKQR